MKKWIRKISKCKNCGHSLIQYSAGLNCLWIHWIGKNNISNECNCGCKKPEPDTSSQEKPYPEGQVLPVQKIYPEAEDIIDNLVQED